MHLPPSFENKAQIFLASFNNNRQALPAVSIVDQSNHTEFQNADRIVLVAYLDEKDAANKKAFQTFAEGLRDEFLFGLTTDPEAVAAAGHIQTPALVMYKQFDEGRNDLTTGDFSASAITAFLKEHATPLFDEITPDNFAMYAEANMPLAYLFIPADDEHREHLVETLKPVASKNKGKINFVWIDAKKFSDHGKSLNLQEPKWPAFAIQKIQDGVFRLFILCLQSERERESYCSLRNLLLFDRPQVPPVPEGRRQR